MYRLSSEPILEMLSYPIILTPFNDSYLKSIQIEYTCKSISNCRLGRQDYKSTCLDQGYTHNGSDHSGHQMKEEDYFAYLSRSAKENPLSSKLFP